MSSLLIVASVGALLALLYTVIAVVVAHLFTTPRRVRSPAHHGTAYERVQFCARGESLQLIASYRCVRDATGVVILVHGRDACRGDELRGTTESLVESLALRGLSVLMLDLRGHGESDHARLTFGRRERHDILGRSISSCTVDIRRAALAFWAPPWAASVRSRPPPRSRPSAR